MDKNILKQYVDIQEEIKSLKKRIERLKKQSKFVSDVVQSSTEFPYSKHSVVISGVDLKRSGKLNKCVILLEERYNKLLDLKKDILNFINKIEDSKIRQIFTYRYIDNLEWFRIAELMGYNGESAVRMKHDRYLKKIEKF